MSKNYTNYNNYQNNQKKNDNFKMEAKKETEKEEVVRSIMDDYLEEGMSGDSSNNINGVVIDCTRLRVRAAANSNADVLCEIKVDTKVIIDIDKSTEEFYKICTEAGVEGYCMKQFIAVE